MTAEIRRVILPQGKYSIRMEGGKCVIRPYDTRHEWPKSETSEVTLEVGEESAQWTSVFNDP